MVRGLLREMSIAIAKEEELSLQCLWQHYLLQGTAWEMLGSTLMQLAINEWMRVEIITGILECLGELPLKKREICLTEKTDDPQEMLRWDRDRLDEIIVSYKDILALAQKEENCMVREAFEEFLADEEEHRTMLGALLVTPATGGFPDNLPREG